MRSLRSILSCILVDHYVHERGAGLVESSSECRFNLFRLFDALTEWMGYPLYFTAYGGSQPTRYGAAHPAIAPYGPFATADGEVVVAIQNERGALSFARREGREQGRAETQAGAVLTVLRVRGIAVPDDARERILTEKDPARLERWHERAILAASVAEVMAEPS